MKASQIINELKKHKKLLEGDISQTEIEKLSEYVRNINLNEVKFENLDTELKELQILVNDIIQKVKETQENILQEIKNTQKKGKAEEAYTKSEILNNR